MDASLRVETYNDALGSTPVLDATEQSPRAFRRGELAVQNLTNGMYALAEEGSFWQATTPTPATGIVGTAATGTSYSDTQALVVVYNSDMRPIASGGKRVYLDAITLCCTAAGTAGTAHHVLGKIDVGNRFGSGGTLLTNVNLNMDYGIASAVKVWGGVVTASASTLSYRYAHRNVLRAAAAPAYIVGDVVTIKFGSQENAAGGINIGATTATQVTVFAPPVILGPNTSYVLNEWMTARSAAQSFEFFVTWVER